MRVPDESLRELYYAPRRDEAMKLKALLSVIGILAAPLAGAQGPHEAIFKYQGPDREQRLVAGAKKEGVATLYTSLAPSESRPLAEAFEKKYGVRIEVWRALSEQVVQRAINEARAKRFTLDTVETNGPEMEVMSRENLFAEFHSPHLADIPASAIPKHRQWIPDRVNFFVVGFNTNKVKEAEIPKSYEGFLDPKWKGRIAVESTDVEWMATLIKLMPKGMAFFKQLSAMRPDMRKGHVLLAELIASGEIQVGLTAYSANIESLKRRGAPVAWVPVEPVVARAQGLAVARNAAHPHAALLFVDYVLSREGQELLLSLGRTPVNTKTRGNEIKFNYTMVDPSTVLEEAEKWNKLWDELLMRQR
jgi:iron(III) transport system substrate-binding protein